MNKKILAGLAALVGVVLLMGSAKADDDLPPPPDPDDDEIPPPPDPDDGDGEPPPSDDDYWAGSPPNISGDAAGYDTDMFKDPNTGLPAMSAVRQWLVNLGYQVQAVGPNAEKLLKNNAEVKRFQKDYNAVAKKGAYLGEKYGMWLEYGGATGRFGHLTKDGTISTTWPPAGGKNTLNAISIAAYVITEWGEDWASIVSKARGND